MLVRARALKSSRPFFKTVTQLTVLKNGNNKKRTITGAVCINRIYGIENKKSTKIYEMGAAMKELKLSTKIIIISVASVVAVALICFAAITFNNRIYSGISVAGVELGGKSADAAVELLEKEEFFTDIPDFTYEDITFSVDPQSINLKCDTVKTAQLAWEYGRDKNIFKRISNIFNLMLNPVELELQTSYDKEALEKIFDENLKDYRQPAIEPEIRLEGDKIYIKNGSGGLEVSEDKLNSDLSAVALGKTDNIELVIETVNPTAISADALHKEYAKEKADAEYTIENMRIKYKESEDGIDFDVEKAEQIINENLKSAKEYYIPLTIIKPDVTVEDIEKTLFGDCLGTYTSRYNPGEVGRTKNVSLAANRISGVVLKKGDVFSYNTIVGERTESRGFSNAKVYAGGEVVDGLGGGICQVSSTLYNAVLYADLEVIERVNHSLPVTYVPLGRDATVVYGSIDFRFKNTYENPIKITSSVGGGVLTISVYGKKESDKTVEISTQRVNTYPFSVKEEPDETIAEGTTKVKQSGSDGASVVTYKRVIENGSVISDKLIHTSVYSPITKVVLVPPVAEETAPVEETAPEQTDEAENNASDISGEPGAETENTDPAEDVTATPEHTDTDSSDNGSSAENGNTSPDNHSAEETLPADAESNTASASEEANGQTDEKTVEVSESPAAEKIEPEVSTSAQ